jgi:uncharacterized protein (DUF2252 family)
MREQKMQFTRKGRTITNSNSVRHATPNHRSLHENVATAQVAWAPVTVAGMAHGHGSLAVRKACSWW